MRASSNSAITPKSNTAEIATRDNLAKPQSQIPRDKPKNRGRREASPCQSNGFFGPSLGEISNRLSADHERNECYTVSPKQPVRVPPLTTATGFVTLLNKFQRAGPVGRCWA